MATSLFVSRTTCRYLNSKLGQSFQTRIGLKKTPYLNFYKTRPFHTTTSSSINQQPLVEEDEVQAARPSRFNPRNLLTKVNLGILLVSLGYGYYMYQKSLKNPAFEQLSPDEIPNPGEYATIATKTKVSTICKSIVRNTYIAKKAAQSPQTYSALRKAILQCDDGQIQFMALLALAAMATASTSIKSKLASTVPLDELAQRVITPETIPRHPSTHTDLSGPEIMEALISAIKPEDNRPDVAFDFATFDDSDYIQSVNDLTKAMRLRIFAVSWLPPNILLFINNLPEKLSSALWTIVEKESPLMTYEQVKEDLFYKIVGSSSRDEMSVHPMEHISTPTDSEPEKSASSTDTESNISETTSKHDSEHHEVHNHEHTDYLELADINLEPPNNSGSVLMSGFRIENKTFTNLKIYAFSVFASSIASKEATHVMLVEKMHFVEHLCRVVRSPDPYFRYIAINGLNGLSNSMEGRKIMAAQPGLYAYLHNLAYRQSYLINQQTVNKIKFIMSQLVLSISASEILFENSPQTFWSDTFTNEEKTELFLQFDPSMADIYDQIFEMTPQLAIGVVAGLAWGLSLNIIQFYNRYGQFPTFNLHNWTNFTKRAARPAIGALPLIFLFNYVNYASDFFTARINDRLNTKRNLGSPKSTSTNTNTQDNDSSSEKNEQEEEQIQAAPSPVKIRVHSSPSAPTLREHLLSLLYDKALVIGTNAIVAAVALRWAKTFKFSVIVPALVGIYTPTFYSFSTVDSNQSNVLAVNIMDSTNYKRAFTQLAHFNYYIDQIQLQTAQKHSKKLHNHARPLKLH